MSDEELVTQLAALIKEYAKRVEAGTPLAETADWSQRLTATEITRISIDLLRAGQITSFELAAMFNI